MAKKIVTNQEPVQSTRKALTLEARENQMIALAENEAERQLREGTASSQVIVHYLRLGTEREKLEKEKLRKENELLIAKAEAYKSAKNIEELYAAAITAMKEYSPGGNSEDDIPEEY